MSREQQMQVRKLCDQKGIKPAMKQTSAEARIAALEAHLGMISQPKGDAKQEGLTKQHRGGTKGILD